MPDESSAEFLARLRKKAHNHKEELSSVEEVFLEVVEKSEEGAILGQGRGSKL